MDEKRNSTNIRTVNINEIPLVSERIKNVIGKNAFSKTNKNGEPIIDENNIIEITDSLKRRNYSFSMIVNEKKYKGPRLYNLIVGVDSTGRMSDPMVLRFKPKEKHEQEWLDNDLDFRYFTGKVSLHKYTAFFNENPLAAMGDLCPPEHDEFGDPIICVEDEVSPSGSGGGASTGGGSYAPAGGGSDDGGGSTTCSFNYYWNYCGGTNEDIAHGSGVCGGDGSGAGWVLEIDCPEYSTSVYFLEGKSSDCPDCATGPSGDLAINTFAKSVIKLESSFSNIDYNLSNSELTWLNINDQVAYELMQPIKNTSWAPETINLSLLNLFREMAQDGWNYGVNGTVRNREALKYKAYYEPNIGESMYLLENGLVLYQSQSERRINKKLSGTIASTEPPTNGYNYIFSYTTQKWYEYRMPPEGSVDTDLNFLFDKFWDGAKFVGRYVLPIEDVLILIDGKDFDGLDQNQTLAAGMLIVGVIPGGKLTKAIKPLANVLETTKAWGAIAKAGNKTISYGLKASGEALDVLVNARSQVGKALGNGVEIKNIWLRGTERNAGFFPKSIADKMRSKNYVNFDQFKQDFWKHVANDPKASKQFINDAASMNEMRNGRAPFANVSQQLDCKIARCKKYNIHHQTPIHQGGAVYDVDNLIIVTPKYHKEILDPKYHFGYGYKTTK